MLFELGLLGPDFWLGLGVVTFFVTRGKTSPRQLGHSSHHVGVGFSGLGVKRNFAVGHGANATKVLAHHEKRALAVFDGVFGFSKLGGSRRGHGQQGGRCGDTCNYFFHHSFLVGLQNKKGGGEGNCKPSWRAKVHLRRVRRVTVSSTRLADLA